MKRRSRVLGNRAANDRPLSTIRLPSPPSCLGPDTMKMQADLFGPVDLDHIDEPDPELLEIPAEPLAVPCGFVDRTNNPCRRLAVRPVMLDGLQMTCRGRRMLHCEAACYSAFNAPAPRTTEDIWP